MKAEFDRGIQLLALTGAIPEAPRGHLLAGIEAYLKAEKIRVIWIRDLGGALDERRFCQLLSVQSSLGRQTRDAGQNLAWVLTAPRFGEHGIGLIVENADALTPEALDLVRDLAVVSAARQPRVRAVLLGSRALEVRLGQAGPLVTVKQLDGALAEAAVTPGGHPHGIRAPIGLAVFGCVAALALFGPVRFGNRTRAPVGSDQVAPVAEADAAQPVGTGGGIGAPAAANWSAEAVVQQAWRSRANRREAGPRLAVSAFAPALPGAEAVASPPLPSVADRPESATVPAVS
ncbi:MAG: hypothetical protein J2P47_14935, partial [Acetobacteraceae bacterium]|nr:hypothetical protein [Acetobacteraceae bacterium]